MIDLFRDVARFPVEPGISVLLVVILWLGRVIIVGLKLSVIINFVVVIAHWVVNGFINTPVSLGVKVLLVLGIMVLRGRGIINGPILMVRDASS